MGAPDYDDILIEKVNIKNIEKYELEYKINELEEKEYYFFSYKEIETFDIKESEAIISSLKLTYISKTLFEYCTYGGSHHF